MFDQILYLKIVIAKIYKIILSKAKATFLFIGFRIKLSDYKRTADSISIQK